MVRKYEIKYVKFIVESSQHFANELIAFYIYKFIIITLIHLNFWLFKIIELQQHFVLELTLSICG